MSSTFLYGANIAANDIRQHYLRYGGTAGERGTRAAVIVIPGITSPAATWGFVGEVFGASFDTYVIDVRGRGLSEASEALDYSLDAQADDVVALAAALGLERFALVGHSMGARIAARAALRAPRALERVVLVDPPVSGPGRRAYPGKLPWYVDSMALARKGTDAEGMRAFCPTWTNEELRLRAEWLHTCDERAVLASYEGFHTDDFHADAARLNVPSLLVTAERGDVVRDEDVAELQRATPTMQHVRVPDAGHMIPWDNAAGFYDAFGTFLGAPLTQKTAAI
ncbi:Hydrolase, alpha/beta fold family (plasmid) [Paraburkholderia caribensis MBA4]|uniref:Hydrolase, alpha/beta fold family n=1 Tax=Paraburkholderia caribensis MBA4 TaxID=1323664 RepID=A0A0P0RR60_9BURK|nr:alpha/beta hydrolase [Paraburkholderia caribensis]ALL71617.1 Hydrolase, alpha/beta fold family [Paraburkholderia caribensis MBA4]